MPENYDDDQLYQPESYGLDDEPNAASEPAAGSFSFRDYLQHCPACGKPLTEQMDSCPFCGDILFRSLRDGTFAPHKTWLRKLFAAIVITLIVLALLTFLALQFPRSF